MEYLLQKLLREGDINEEFDFDSDDVIGDGAYSTVYSARRYCDNREYAVKRIDIETVRVQDLWKSVVHEIEILRRLDHPNCVKYIDSFRSSTHIYLIMEWIKGGELLPYITRRTRLKEADAANMCGQLIEAVRYLHNELGIVHRDLKPENILVEKGTSTIKVIDFGHAKFIGKIETRGEESLASLHTQLPEILQPTTPPPHVVQQHLESGETAPLQHARLDSPKGTITYMAPEILINITRLQLQARVTTREEIKKIDIFAIGVCLYFMLSGGPPFVDRQNAAGNSHRAKNLLSSVEQGVMFTKKAWQFVDEDAKQFCKQTLASQPSQRPNIDQAMHNRWLLKHWTPPQQPIITTTTTTPVSQNCDHPKFLPSPTSMRLDKPKDPGTPSTATTSTCSGGTDEGLTCSEMEEDGTPMAHHTMDCGIETVENNVDDDDHDQEGVEFERELSIQLIDDLREQEDSEMDPCSQNAMNSLQRVLSRSDILLPMLTPVLDHPPDFSRRYADRRGSGGGSAASTPSPPILVASPGILSPGMKSMPKPTPSICNS